MRPIQQVAVTNYEVVEMSRPDALQGLEHRLAMIGAIVVLTHGEGEFARFHLEITGNPPPGDARILAIFEDLGYQAEIVAQ